MKRDIKSLLIPELEEYIASIGERPYRAEQIFKWLHKTPVDGAADIDKLAFSEMSNLPAKFREILDAEFEIVTPSLAVKQTSRIDGTVKYLWRLHDGNSVESVVMDYEHGKTVCISTQVGCRMNCAFCASALNGFVRNLSASEMEDQVALSQLDSGKRISNIVLMGIGEPLDNFVNVIRFLELITHKSGMNISARKATLSTCGIIENIDKLAEYDIKLALSVSLHAPDDETRSRLMPVNRAVGVDRLLEACGMYFRATGRRVTYEYALINEVNDSRAQALLLSEKLKNSGSHVNLIPLNDVPERSLISSPYENIKAFAEILRQNGVNFTVRRKLGGDISASCGQLRLKTSSRELV